MEILKMNEWDKYFFKFCDITAEKSRDRSTKVGAVIVGPDNEIRSVGYNGFPRGINDDVDERYERPLKYKYTEHAERNAIYNAGRVGIPLKGCRIYINSLPPCCDCARAIIQSGITDVNYIVDGEIPERWQADCDMSVGMLEEAGVVVRKFNRSDLHD